MPPHKDNILRFNHYIKLDKNQKIDGCVNNP